jgi:hypothetical protein
MNALTSNHPLTWTVTLPADGQRRWTLAQSDPDDAPHRLSGGLIYLNGYGLNVTAIRVRTQRPIIEQIAYALEDDDELNALWMLDDTAFVTAQIAGFPGDWVLYLTPMGA